MLTLVIPDREYYNENTEEFFVVKGATLKMEHSLVSVSKWESRYKKPFISKEQKTLAELIYYAKCMTITQNVNPAVYRNITKENLKTMNDYIEDTMTATFFSGTNDKPNNRIITSELIYCWMIQLQIPVEFQRWHLNRLITLIKVCNEENTPPDKRKMSQRDLMARNDALNEERKKMLKTRG